MATLFDTNYTSLREVQRNPKKVVQEISATNKPTIVISGNKPQFAIVSIQMLTKMQENSGKGSVQGLINLVNWAEEQNFALPNDLSAHHNKYAWDEQ